MRTLARNSSRNLDGNPGGYLVENPNHTDTFNCSDSDFLLPIATSNIFRFSFSVFTNIEISLHLWPLFVPTFINPLSNDTGKKRQYAFLTYKCFHFYAENALTYKKAVYEKKCILSPVLKGVLSC